MCVIRKLKAHFARHGIPEQLVTDNGSQFTSGDFLKFSRDWDFEHLTSSPHHSQGNDKAESAVEEAKKILRKCRASGSDAFLALLDHRNTSPASVQVSPAQRLFNRRTRSLLPMKANLLTPQAVSDNELCRAKLEQRKQRQAQYYNRSAVDLDPLRRGDGENGRKESCEVDWMRDRMRSRRLTMWFVATAFTCEGQMSRHHHHRTRPSLRCMFSFVRSPMSYRPPFPRK